MGTSINALFVPIRRCSKGRCMRRPYAISKALRLVLDANIDFLEVPL